MKLLIGVFLIVFYLAGCETKNNTTATLQPQLRPHCQFPEPGNLFPEHLIEKGDTTVTDYTKDISFIKIINDDHFAFLSHDAKSAPDSAKNLMPAVEVIL